MMTGDIDKGFSLTYLEDSNQMFLVQQGVRLAERIDGRWQPLVQDLIIIEDWFGNIDLLWPRSSANH